MMTAEKRLTCHRCVGSRPAKDVGALRSWYSGTGLSQRHRVAESKLLRRYPLAGNVALPSLSRCQRALCTCHSER